MSEDQTAASLLRPNGLNFQIITRFGVVLDPERFLFEDETDWKCRFLFHSPLKQLGAEGGDPTVASFISTRQTPWAKRKPRRHVGEVVLEVKLSDDSPWEINCVDFCRYTGEVVFLKPQE